MSEVLLDIEHLSLTVPATDGSATPILRDVSLQIRAGEALGLVGESGSGKSMTARTVMRLLPRGAVTAGTVRWRGRDLLALPEPAMRRLRAAELAMVFQDPRAVVNPLATVGEFLTEMLRERGTSRAESRRLVAGLLGDIGVDRIEQRLRQRPHELSGGLLQRVVIAAALAVEPALILADEPTTALDVTTQEEVVAILDEQRRGRGTALLFISHDLQLAAALCDRIAVMYAGRIVEVLPAQSLHEDAAHPYTRALLASRPGTVPLGHRLQAVPGRPQSAAEAPATCVFADRCPLVHDRCRTHEPPRVPTSGGHVTCHRPHHREEPVR